MNLIADMDEGKEIRNPLPNIQLEYPPTANEVFATDNFSSPVDELE